MTIDASDLQNHLPGRRWFGGKGRTIASLELVDEGVLDDGPPALELAIVKVVYADGDSEHYHLPLIVHEDGTWRDAFDEPKRLALLGELLAHGVSIKGSTGVFGFSGAGMDPLSPPGTQSIRAIGAEQTNTSVVLDERYILKVFRKVALGPNPDLELSRLLTNKSFEHTPGHAGEISFEGELDGEEVVIDLGIAQPFISDAIEGWDKTLQAVRELYDAIHEADAPEDRKVLTEERAGDILEQLASLGDVTAAMHVALTRDETDPDLAPAEIESHDLEEWADRALASLRREMEHEPELAELAPAIQERIAQLPSVEDPGPKTRVHGDYHLGQVLFSRRGWMVIDFEGEPNRSLDERRAKQSPLRDVAGMLRSFSYATVAVMFERAEPGSDGWDRLEPWADCFESLAADRFLHAYLSKSHEGTFLPAERETQITMLDVFEIDKALYELGYERTHRPDWKRIPLKGIQQVISRRDV